MEGQTQVESALHARKRRKGSKLQDQAWVERSYVRGLLREITRQRLELETRLEAERRAIRMRAGDVEEEARRARDGGRQLT